MADAHDQTQVPAADELVTGTRLGFPDTPIELILARQVASYLALPIILTDADGDLVFYNEPAEELLGLRFDNTGPLPLIERVQALTLRDEGGSPMPFEDVPLVRALKDAHPDNQRLILRGLDGIDRPVETTAFPLTRRDGTLVGGVAVFWERPPSESG
jgi:PAS domain-containing protein